MPARADAPGSPLLPTIALTQAPRTQPKTMAQPPADPWPLIPPALPGRLLLLLQGRGGSSLPKASSCPEGHRRGAGRLGAPQGGP